jgi:2-polyprenyl-3-methyl-5-hydroxy-6-metoxy-1,4-benzoquinol methylase
MGDARYRYVLNPLGYFSVEPMPSPVELEAYYRDLYYQELTTSSYQAEYSKDERAHIAQRSAVILHAIALARGTGAAGARLFEVGAGEGFLLDAASRAGFDVTGIDFSAHGIDKFNPHMAARMHFGDAYRIINDLAPEGYATDAVVLQNVLEHVIDPDALLAGVKQLMRPGGVIVVKVPNDFSRLQRTAMERGVIDREFWFAPPAHLHYFTAPSLEALLRKAGFLPLDAFADFPIDWFLFHPGSNYIRDPVAGKPAHHARIALDLLLGENGLDHYYDFLKALASCGMGRNIAVVARRPDV